MESLSTSSFRGFHAPRVRAISISMVLMACILSFLLFRTSLVASSIYAKVATATDDYLSCIQAANDLMDASNYLTSQSRLFVMTHDLSNAENYFSEELTNLRREEAVKTIDERADDKEEQENLSQALSYSNALAEREHYAMLLVMDAEGMEIPSSMTPLLNMKLTEKDQALSPEEKLELGQSMLFNTVYQEQKNLIEHHVSLCTNGLIDDARTAKDQAVTKLELVLLQQKLLTVALLLVVLVLATEMLLLVLRPIRHYIESIKEDKPLVAEGAYDLRYLAEAYNEMYEENRIRRERLQHAAEHDPLTGLYNRGAYDVLIEDNTKDIALLLIDIDHFKEVNDTYGHAVGDEVLKKVARLLSSTFRATDYPCRIGGDEFAVIMTGVDSNLSLIVEDKIAQVTDALREPEGEIPGLTLSIGIAFSDELEGSDAAPTTFKAADQALYVVKERGRNGHLFYHEIAG